MNSLCYDYGAIGAISYSRRATKPANNRAPPYIKCGCSAG